MKSKKISKYWIIKNKIYYKKLNLNEDMCLWEGWKIELRASEPSYINMIFIVLRRKYLPPYYDSYQNFIFNISEFYLRENFTMSNKCLEIIELAANSIFYSGRMNEKEYDLFLKAKLDGLLIDEDTIKFYQNRLNIATPEVYEAGYHILKELLSLFENTKERQKISNTKYILENKIKALNTFLYVPINTEPFEFKGSSSRLIQIVTYLMLKYNYDKILDIIKNNNCKNSKNKDNNNSLNNSDEEDEHETNDSSGLTKYNNNNYSKIINFESSKLGAANNNKNSSNNLFFSNLNKEIDIKKKALIWHSKVYKFLAFCVNGGLTDNAFTFENLIEHLNTLQNSTSLSEINEFIFNCINLRDLDAEPIVNSINDKSDNSKNNTNKLTNDLPNFVQVPKLHIPSITERTKITFNEDILVIVIKTGWLTKYLNENIKHAINFYKIILKKFCSNKLLNSIYHYIKLVNDYSGEDASKHEERNAITLLINTIIDIFKDNRRNPLTITIAGKCLCALICKECDKRNRIILMQEDIVKYISLYFTNYYEYDEKLTSVCLELFTFILPELKGKINDYLGDYNNVNLLNIFKNMLKSNSIPGTFYSQRILVKVLTTMLSMTNILEAGLKDRFNSPNDIKIYNILIDIVDDNKKKDIINPYEEHSYITEFKVFYLLFILVNKNERAKDYLYNILNIINFVERKACSYKDLLEQVLSGIKNKDGFSEGKIGAINQTIKKFSEFCYTLIINDKEKILLFYRKCEKFNLLLKFINENRNNIGMLKEFDVYIWIDRLYKDLSEEDNLA